MHATAVEAALKLEGRIFQCYWRPASQPPDVAVTCIGIWYSRKPKNPSAANCLYDEGHWFQLGPNEEPLGTPIDDDPPDWWAWPPRPESDAGPDFRGFEKFVDRGRYDRLVEAAEFFVKQTNHVAIPISGVFAKAALIAACQPEKADG